MNSTTLNTKTRYAVDNFLYGVYYPCTAAAWAFLCFCLNIQWACIFPFVILACYILIKGEDLTPVIPLFTAFIISVKNYAQLTSVPYFILYAVLLGCFIYHLIKFPVKSFLLGKLFFPLFLVSTALFLGGLTSAYVLRYANGLPQIIASGPALIAVYLLFLNGIKPPENFSVKTYFSYAVVFTTIFACFEIILFYYTKSNHYFTMERSLIWGNFNTVGAMTIISVPLCCYLITKTDKSAAFFAVIIFFLIVDIVCASDGSVGVIAFSLPFLVVATFCKLKKNARREFMLCLFAVVFAICAAAVFYGLTKGFDEILAFATKRTATNGRDNLYERALKLFRENPLLGVGQCYYDESVYSPSMTFNFHSTIFHVIATMGCLGIIAYSVYYFYRFRIIMSGQTAFSFFAYLSFVLFEAYGIIDICEFNLIPLTAYITVLIALIEKETVSKREGTSLPLLF
ncbi:MAG: O-antigen ligase family protein [Clostridia bacterium]|nr:O-antigen ligase family protein [Clostridia bacterium]